MPHTVVLRPILNINYPACILKHICIVENGSMHHIVGNDIRTDHCLLLDGIQRQKTKRNVMHKGITRVHDAQPRHSLPTRVTECDTS